MAERYTVITGKQIKAAVAADGLQKDASENIAIDVSDFAGYGLKDDGSENLDLDLNELTAAAIDVSADEFAIIDATDASTKKESIADLMTAVAGDGLTATAGVLAVNVDDSTIEIATDVVQVKDGGITEAKLDIFNSPTDDYVLSWNAAQGKPEWVEDVLPAGGLVAADIVKNEVPTGLINDANVTYTLANTPTAGTVEVFLNGVLQAPGSGKDYTISGGTVTFAIAPATGSVLLVHYFK